MSSISKRRNTAGNLRALTFLLSPEDRERLDHLASTWDCSLAEAIRRSVLSQANRVDEGRVATKYEQILEEMREIRKAMAHMGGDVAEHKSRTENQIAIIRRMENDLKAELDPLGKNINSTAIRVLAMIRTFKNREEIEANVQRILAGA